jgi:hypothetical protein
MTSRIAVTAGLLLFAASMSANAMDVHTYNHLKKTTAGGALLYLVGVGQGYYWANAELKERGDKELFCMPKALEFTAYDYTKIYERELDLFVSNHDKGIETLSVDLLLLLGMEKTYPCPK